MPTHLSQATNPPGIPTSKAQPPMSAFALLAHRIANPLLPHEGEYRSARRRVFTDSRSLDDKWRNYESAERLARRIESELGHATNGNAPVEFVEKWAVLATEARAVADAAAEDLRQEIKLCRSVAMKITASFARAAKKYERRQQRAAYTRSTGARHSVRTPRTTTPRRAAGTSRTASATSSPSGSSDDGPPAREITRSAARRGVRVRSIASSS